MYHSPVPVSVLGPRSDSDYSSVVRFPRFPLVAPAPASTQPPAPGLHLPQLGGEVRHRDRDRHTTRAHEVISFYKDPYSFASLGSHCLFSVGINFLFVQPEP